MHRLFFLPGAGADPDFWRPVGDRLPGDWDKLYFGWPGLGRQPPHPDVRRFDDLVDLVERELAGGPIDLLAQSMGGLVAMKLALRRPEAVRRIVLTVTSGGVDVEGLGGVDWRPDYRASFPDAMSYIFEACEDLTARLPAIVSPVLLLWGDADPISPVTVGERLCELLPDARLVVIPGGTHEIVQDRADEVTPLIRAFLA